MVILALTDYGVNPRTQSFCKIETYQAERSVFATKHFGWSMTRCSIANEWRFSMTRSECQWTLISRVLTTIAY